MSTPQAGLPGSRRTISTSGVFIASMALVVSASTLVTDFTGFASLGWGFVVSLAIGFLIVLPLAVSASHLTIAHPRAGGIYHLTRSVLKSSMGDWTAVCLGFVFFGTFLFGAVGETMAGAHALRALFGSALSAKWFVLVIAATAVVPNLFGLRNATWVTGALLVVMLGIRWYFGLAGFFGGAHSGEWSLANIQVTGGFRWFGQNGVFTCGLAFGFWSFVGIEGACSLAEETKQPRKSIPRGLILAMLAIFVTSTVMGLGAVGTLPLEQWQGAVESASNTGGMNPQLVFGEMMFGPSGRVMMAVASIASTLSSLLIAFAAVPRMIFAMARDGRFFGAVATKFAQVHERTGVPVAATILVVVLYLITALAAGVAIDCLYAAAYLWFIRYVIVHVLTIVSRFKNNANTAIFGRHFGLVTAVIGVIGTVLALVVGFAGSHQLYGSRALMMVGGAIGVTAVSFAMTFVASTNWASALDWMVEACRVVCARVTARSEKLAVEV